ncbi:hypothetical protein WR164_04320 [Philodulcilactobacillus myokoensis]|uniref:DUF3290 domain-containing protein n=1 Tax=Philodulcilactobacillus myokoensis TaxID=2929573 RepID=A0A9W6B138_9LACO|nr:DUF3290 family protein [Philodulcilactobacillus myokoensis]GLB46453.1 hypothetical protein WR164_04320 [Philodulcilactobacillus myokoensis]
MTLYSYSYLTGNNGILSYTGLIIGIIIGVTILVYGFKYMRDRNNLKFRDIFIILTMLAVLIISVQFNKILSQRTNDGQNIQTARIIQQISKDRHVPTSQIYSDSTSLTDGMTIKVKSTYYRVNLSSTLNNYSLSKTNPVNPNVNYVNQHSFDLNILNGSNEYWAIGLKLLIGFIMLIFQINLSGKGNLAPSNAIDQLQNYVLGGIIGGMIYNQDITILMFFIVLLIWSLIIFGSRVLVHQYPLFKRILTGSPQQIINNGRINVSTALRNGLSASDLTFKLRMSHVGSYQEIKNAVLEQNGQLTITKYNTESISYPVITDGNINSDVLIRMKKPKEWLLDMIKQHHTELASIYLGQFLNGKLYIINYPEKPKRLAERYHNEIIKIRTRYLKYKARNNVRRRRRHNQRQQNKENHQNQK